MSSSCIVSIRAFQYVRRPECRDICGLTLRLGMTLPSTRSLGGVGGSQFKSISSLGGHGLGKAIGKGLDLALHAVPLIPGSFVESGTSEKLAVNLYGFSCAISANVAMPCSRAASRYAIHR